MSSSGDIVAVDGGDRSSLIVVCAVLLTAFALFAVGLRFYVRCAMLRSVKSEDWLMLVSMIFSFIAGAFLIVETRHGIGKHMTDVSRAEMTAYLKFSYFQTLFYNLSILFTKLSILVLYLRVLTHEWVRKLTWVVIAIVAIYNAWAIAMYLTMCIPIQRMWDPTVPGKCHPWSVWWALTYLHIITDFMIFLVPLPVLVPMTIPMRQKAGLLAVFMVGLFVCLVSVIRTVWLDKLLYVEDVTWEMAVIANWSSAEMNVAIVCGCMPALKPILSKVFGPVVDRVLPKQLEELEEPGEGRPRTIGSMPMKAFRFGRSTKTQVETIAEEPAGPWTDKQITGGSLTDVETQASDQAGNEIDPELGLGSAGRLKEAVRD
ncbi:hypothetical protein OQA88_961 [Cercophora sp. LCS_1]